MIIAAAMLCTGPAAYAQDNEPIDGPAAELARDLHGLITELEARRAEVIELHDELQAKEQFADTLLDEIERLERRVTELEKLLSEAGDGSGDSGGDDEGPNGEPEPGDVDPGEPGTGDGLRALDFSAPVGSYADETMRVQWDLTALRVQVKPWAGEHAGEWVDMTVPAIQASTLRSAQPGTFAANGIIGAGGFRITGDWTTKLRWYVRPGEAKPGPMLFDGATFTVHGAKPGGIALEAVEGGPVHLRSSVLEGDRYGLIADPNDGIASVNCTYITLTGGESPFRNQGIIDVAAHLGDTFVNEHDIPAGRKASFRAYSPNGEGRLFIGASEFIGGRITIGLDPDGTGSAPQMPLALTWLADCDVHNEGSGGAPLELGGGEVFLTRVHITSPARSISVEPGTVVYTDGGSTFNGEVMARVIRGADR